jgi:carbon-monoxide dehydrogenase medium subunit
MLLQLPEFELHLPGTVPEACSLLRKYGQDACILAGGTDLLVKMKLKRALPRHLVNIKCVPGLDAITCDERGLHIGALANIQSINESPVIAQKFPMLRTAAGKLGTTQIRNRGTLGGNLGNASPSAETATVLMVHEASVCCVGPEGERMIPVGQFFVGPGRTVLAAGEIITSVDIPPMPLFSGGSYRKHSLRPMEVAIAAAAVMVVRDGDDCAEARIALGAVGPTPFRASKAEAFINGRTLTAQVLSAEVLDEAAEIAAREASPIDDIRGRMDYRMRVVRMLVRDGLEQAVALSWE